MTETNDWNIDKSMLVINGENIAEEELDGILSSRQAGGWNCIAKAFNNAGNQAVWIANFLQNNSTVVNTDTAKVSVGSASPGVMWAFITYKRLF